MEQTAAGVNHVGHIAFPLVGIRSDEWLPQPTDNLGWILAVEQERTDAILAHRANTMAQHEPPCVGFDRRAAVAYLYEFPWETRFQEELCGIPEVQVVREHHVEVFVILPAKHRVMPADFPREQRHAFVLHRSTIQGDEFEMKKVCGLDELRQNQFSVIGSVGSIVNGRPILVFKTNEP